MKIYIAPLAALALAIIGIANLDNAPTVAWLFLYLAVMPLLLISTSVRSRLARSRLFLIPQARAAHVAGRNKTFLLLSYTATALFALFWPALFIPGTTSNSGN